MRAVLLAVGLLAFSATKSTPGPKPGVGLHYAHGVSLSYGYDQRPERAFQLAAEARIGAVRAMFNWFQLMDNPRQNPWAAAMGLLDSHIQPKPAYYAYGELTGGLAATPTVGRCCSLADDADLRSRLTPEVRRCILQKLGRQEARRVAEAIRAKARIDPDTWTRITSCFEKAAPPTTPATPPAMPKPTPGPAAAVSPIFGVHVVLARNTTPDAAVIRSLGARVTTLWLYPAPGGRFNVHLARRLVNMIKEQTGGLDVYVHLMPNARSEAMGDGEGDPEPPESGAGFTLPSDMNTYLASVRELVTALKGSVMYYSIANEVSGFSWKGTVQDYGTLLAQSVSAIKGVDPHAKILDSGMAGLTYAMTIPNTLYQAGKTAEAIDFIRRYTQNHVGAFRQFLPIDNEDRLQAMLADPRVQKTIRLSDARFREYCPYYDIFQLHDYQGWETMEEVYDWIHEQMRANHCVKPIQAWEIGYGRDRNLPYDVNEHARTVPKVLTISAVEGAQTIIYFPLSERGAFARPLLGPNNEIQPPAIAYQVTVAKLAEATSPEKLHLGDGVWGYKFGRRSGGDVYVLWATASTTVRLPLTASQVTVTDHTGRTTTASPEALPIGVDPVFVEANGDWSALSSGPPHRVGPVFVEAKGSMGRPPDMSRPTGQNPFGVMLPSQLVRSPGGIQVARTLGAVYFRPTSVFLDQWNGTCLECDIALNAGLQLVLTVRNSGPLPTAPPHDLAAYQRMLGQVLDKYRPVVLAVENEENSALFYTGTPEDYAAELKAACQVAHRRGIPCTNGGLVSTLVALLVYDHYRTSGQLAMARDFAARAFPPEMRRQLDSPQAWEQLRKGKALLSAYRSAGVDYVNFHWYIADTQALEEAVAYLRAQTGLSVITNEVGQTTDDPNQTTAVMGKIVELGIPIAVWFGLDGPKARGLVNLDGSLRPTGEAFRRFIEQNFK